VIANNIKRVAVESRQVTGTQVDDSSVMQVAARGRGRSPPRYTCFACGKPDHRRGDAKCLAQGKQCSLCGETNHFAACCKRKPGGARMSDNLGRQKYNKQRARNSTSVGMIDVTVAGVSRRFSKSKAVRCTLNSVNLCLIVDTRAVSLLNADTVARLQLNIGVADVVLKTSDGYCT
jgi:hypothetical protein